MYRRPFRNQKVWRISDDSCKDESKDCDKFCFLAIEGGIEVGFTPTSRRALNPIITRLLAMATGYNLIGTGSGAKAALC